VRAMHLTAVLVFLSALVSSTGLRVSITINSDGAQKGVLPVPLGFMGLSHEPMSLAGYYCQDPVYQQLLQTLTSYNTGPFSLRWGGNAQDIETSLFPDTVWEGMKHSWQLLGGRVSHTIGLNLMARNTTYALLQLQNAVRILPPESVAAINVGNEPDSLGYRHPAEFGTDYLKRSTKGWLADQLMFMKVLAPTLQQWLGTTRVFSGPAAANSKEFPSSMVSKWAQLGSSNKGPGPYAKIVTMHHYVMNAKRNAAQATVENLLAESKSVIAHTMVTSYSKAAAKQGLIYRTDETNSISSQGTYDVSDTLAAALWTIDNSLVTLQSGGSGVNYHSVGCATYNMVFFPGFCGAADQIDPNSPKFQKECPNTCGQANAPAIPSAPYFGMWFTQQALSESNELKILPVEAALVLSRTDVKMFVLRNLSDVRVVLINRANSPAEPTEVSFTVTGHADWGPATAWRLLSTNGTLSARVETISFGGQAINLQTGQREGRVVTETYQPTPSVQGKTYTVSMPPASAALLVVRDQSLVSAVKCLEVDSFTSPSPH